jgi:SAM-dependent methyltransferase
MLPVSTPYLNRQIDEVLRFIPDQPGLRSLEVGCGMGRYTLILWERGLAVEGLDLSPVLLQRLREFDGGRHDHPLYCADILHPPQELESCYELLFGFFTLHHLHHLQGCFSAMATLLKPGGQILFLEPNPFNPLYYIQITFTPGMTWQAEGGLLRMRRSILQPALESAGFRSVAIHRFGFFPPIITNLSGGVRLEGLLEKFPPFKPFLPFQIVVAEKA